MENIFKKLTKKSIFRILEELGDIRGDLLHVLLRLWLCPGTKGQSKGSLARIAPLLTHRSRYSPWFTEELWVPKRAKRCLECPLEENEG